jgi:hypothetical protein
MRPDARPPWQRQASEERAAHRRMSAAVVGKFYNPLVEREPCGDYLIVLYIYYSLARLLLLAVTLD